MPYVLSVYLLQFTKAEGRGPLLLQFNVDGLPQFRSSLLSIAIHDRWQWKHWEQWHGASLLLVAHGCVPATGSSRL